MRLPTWFVASVSTCCMLLQTRAQENSRVPAKRVMPARVQELNLPPGLSQQLEAAVSARHYLEAERLLLPRVSEAQDALQKANLLSYLGSVYFVEGDVFQAAVAWKKSDLLQPLAPQIRFSLAMAYVRLRRGDWARTELVKLAAQQPANPLYPYWMGRVDYDAQLYSKAVAEFQKAIALDDNMARAHDNLGLCFFYLNQNNAAEAEYRKAIALEDREAKPSAWPHLNLALELEFTNQLNEAIAELRTAIALDPAFAQAEYELGGALQLQGKFPEAMQAFKQAARLDPTYPEPHLGMARLLRRSAEADAAQREVETYKRLQSAKIKGAPIQTGAP